VTLVKDSGIGFPEGTKHADQLAFSDNLARAESLVERWNGRLEILSPNGLNDDPNRPGTTVRIVFPALDVAESDAST